MKARITYLMWAMLLIFVLLFSGCGGGSGSYNAHDTDQEQKEVINPDDPINPNDPEQNEDTTPPVDDKDEVDNFADYVPYSYTDEELIAMARDVVPVASFDLSLLEDDEEDSAIISSSALTSDLQSDRAKQIIRNMWKTAVKLAIFPNSVDVPYKTEEQTIRLNQTITLHDTYPDAKPQKRFLYVYPSYVNSPALETFPYVQYLSGGCKHEIMGTDCVGFIYQCTYAATKNYNVTIGGQTVKGLRMRHGPTSSGLGSAQTWINTGLFPNAKLITDKSQPPNPGDILVWSGHVGIAVRINHNTIGVAHSTGTTLYTCDQYKEYANEDINWVGYPSERSYSGKEGVNGFVIHEYNNYIQHHSPGGGAELYRVRLEDTEISDEYETVISKVSGIWKPIDAKLSGTNYNDYGLPESSWELNFVKYNPDDPDNSSSLMINVSVEKIMNETGYQSMKPEYVISNDGQIVISDHSNHVYIEDIFRWIWYFSPYYALSGDILIRGNDNINIYTGTQSNFSTVSFPDTSTMKITQSEVDANLSEDLVIILQRSDVNEKPEPDEWLEKLAGDWIPVDYTITNSDTKDKSYFVPYNPDADEDLVSSPVITITPKREYNYYKITNEGHVTTADFNLILTKLCLFDYVFDVSGDVLISEENTIVEFPDDDSMVITNAQDIDGFMEYIELKRKQ